MWVVQDICSFIFKKRNVEENNLKGSYLLSWVFDPSRIWFMYCEADDFLSWFVGVFLGFFFFSFLFCFGFFVFVSFALFFSFKKNVFMIGVEF